MGALSGKGRGPILFLLPALYACSQTHNTVTKKSFLIQD